MFCLTPSGHLSAEAPSDSRRQETHLTADGPLKKLVEQFFSGDWKKQWRNNAFKIKSLVNVLAWLKKQWQKIENYSGDLILSWVSDWDWKISTVHPEGAFLALKLSKCAFWSAHLKKNVAGAAKIAHFAIFVLIFWRWTRKLCSGGLWGHEKTFGLINQIITTVLFSAVWFFSGRGITFLGLHPLVLLTMLTVSNQFFVTQFRSINFNQKAENTKWYDLS